MIIWARSGANS